MNIPYVSQVGNDPKNDCGLACVLMLAQAIGVGLYDTVYEWSKKIDQADDGTTDKNLADMIKQLGLTPITGVGVTQYPYIEIVNYKSLPDANKYDKTGTFLHWIVRLSATNYHDPYWPSAVKIRGANMVAGSGVLDNAEYARSMRVGIKEVWDKMTEYKAREPYDRVIHYVEGSQPADVRAKVFATAAAAGQSATLSADDAFLPIDGLRSIKVILWNISNQEAYRAFYNQYYKSNIPTTLEFRSTSVIPTPPTTDPNAGKWKVEFFPNTTLSGAPIQTAYYDSLNFNWGAGNPLQNVAHDFFSARATRTTSWAAGEYEWSATADDGVRLFVDGEKIIDGWIQQGETTYKGRKTLTAGNHTEVLEYFEAGGNAVMKLTSAKYVPPVKPPATSKAKRSALLGVHVISHHQYATTAYNLGARAFTWMEGLTGASDFKKAHPDAIVMWRKYLDRRPYDATGLIQACQGMAEPNLVYIGVNEDDQESSSNLKSFIERAKRDVEVAKRLKQFNPTSIFLAGEFAMGCPQLENADFQQAVRDIYTPAYNAGLIALGFHTYTAGNHWVKPDGSYWNGPQDGYPFAIDQDGKPVDPIWYSLRWHYLFTHCDFDPRIQNIYSGESGADKMGTGGFPAQGTTQEQFRQWCEGFVYTQRKPVVVPSGKRFAGTWPSPMKATTLFQWSDFPDWAGYKIDGFASELQRQYAID